MPSDNKQKPSIWALFGKMGGKIFSFIGKFIKLSKLGWAAASFASYAVFYSWKFALLIMIAIGFHESGHVWAMKRMGIKTKGFYFLPFIGGAAIAEEQYRTYGENAYIAIMGPIWGMAMSFAAAGLYWTTGNPMWAGTAAWIAFINLFNLLPITPLDGGQLMRSIAFSINKTFGVVFLAVSLVGAGLVLWKLHIGLFVLLLVVGAIELAVELSARIKLKKFQAGKLQRWDLPSRMFDAQGVLKHYPGDMNWKQIAMTAVAYGGTIVCLIELINSLKHIPGADLAADFLK